MIFKGFFQTFDTSASQDYGLDTASQNVNNSYQSNSDEEMKDSSSMQDINLSSSEIRLNQDANANSSSGGAGQILSNDVTCKTHSKSHSHSKQLKKLREFWKQKQKTNCSIQIYSHSAIIASKSPVLSKIIMEAKAQMGSSLSGDKKIVVDFHGQYLYQAFKRVIDYCYLADMNLFNDISDSNEMIEIIKLANQFKLGGMI